jgi:hypothetical protein
MTKARWKVMDVAFGDNRLHPRRLVIEVNEKFECCRYTTCCEDGDGIGYCSEHSLRTLDEWLDWLDRFSDELTGREIREAKEAARAEFAEPQSWADFRKRYAETGDPWLPMPR